MKAGPPSRGYSAEHARKKRRKWRAAPCGPSAAADRGPGAVSGRGRVLLAGHDRPRGLRPGIAFFASFASFATRIHVHSARGPIAAHRQDPRPGSMVLKRLPTRRSRRGGALRRGPEPGHRAAGRRCGMGGAGCTAAPPTVRPRSARPSPAGRHAVVEGEDDAAADLRPSPRVRGGGAKSRRRGLSPWRAVSVMTSAGCRTRHS